MPEATEDAVFLIATSYQALGRVNEGDDQTMTCNCTVVLIFAAFFVEANLTHILEVIGDLDKVKKDVGRRNPGLYPKLAWFYARHVKQLDTLNRDVLFSPEFEQHVYDAFPGLEEIIDFRNSVAHGTLVRSLTNPTDAARLRQLAKDAVKELFRIASNAGHAIPRTVTYAMAISSNPDVDAS